MTRQWLRVPLLVITMTIVSSTQAVGKAVDQPDSSEKAYTFWLKGNYAEAWELYDHLDDAAPVVVAIGKSRCQRSQGKYAEAMKELSSALVARPGHSNLLAHIADLHFFHGRDEEALAKADESLHGDENDLLARWVRARVFSATGRHEKANAELEWFIDYYNVHQPTDPEELLLVAMTVAEYARWNELPDEFDFILNELLVDATSQNENFWQAAWYAGVLLVEKYNKAEGVPEFQNALKINPSSAEALVGLGVGALQDYDFTTGPGYADQALEINPNFPDALRLKADFLLADSKTEAALVQLRKALRINPVSEETLGRIAACYHLQKKLPKVAEVEKEVRNRTPKPGVYFHRLAEQLEKRRQFDSAEKYYREAIELAPHLAGPLNGLGMLYMRIGKESEAREIFEKARELDPFHVRVLNMTKVLRHMNDYRSILSDHYEIWVDPELDMMLGKYMSEYLESNHAVLCERFGYEPPGRVLIEVLLDHRWFSARVIGLPRIGTVGACTGKVIALASPRSLRSPYNWARVLTHELTHIITLQQTNFNIPHWFTEALAVHSEGYPRPQIWNELLAERVPKGELLDLQNINHAFVRPKTQLDWQMAYCQSLLYAEYMIDEFGEETIAELLDVYADGLETESAIPKVFEISLEKFEEGYRKYLGELVAGLKVSSSATGSLSFAEAERAFRQDPKNADLAAELALHHHRRRNNARARELANKSLELAENHPLALYILARMELSIGKVDEALEILRAGSKQANPDLRVLELMAEIRIRKKEYDESAKLYLRASEADPLNSKWLEGLARAYFLGKEETKLADTLEKLAEMESDKLTIRKKLAELKLASQEWEQAQRWARESLYLDVSDARIHRIYAEATLAQKKFPLAIREYKAAISLGSEDTDLPLKLAEAYLGAGEKEKARKQLKKILEKDPDNQRAKELMKGI